MANDVLFPTTISMGSQGGPEWATSKQMLGDGTTRRNIRWTYPLHKYDISYGIKSKADVYTVLKFFQAHRGEGYSFKFQDPFDNLSCAPGETPAYDDIEILANAEAGQTQVQLIKTYTLGTLTATRKITLPVTATVLIGKNGVQQTETTHYTVNTLTGIVTFNSGLSVNDTITAGYQFYVPVFFDQAELMISTRNTETAEVGSIMLIEEKT